MAYVVVVIAAGAHVRCTQWGFRALSSNPIDYSWQLALPWHAFRGEWVGRELQFPMGPLWQALAYVGALPGPFDAARAVAGMQAVVQSLGAVVALVIACWASPRTVVRVAAFGVLTLLAYGAGIATLRALLSLAFLLLYLPSEDSERAPRWRDSAAAAAVATLAGLLSIDRLVFVAMTAALMSVGELLVRRSRGLPLRFAWMRLCRFGVAQLAALAAVTLLGVVVGARPWQFLLEQRAMAASYAVTLAKTAESNVVNVLLLVASAAALAVLAVRRPAPTRLTSCWVIGAMPPALFAVPQPNAGHVFMGVLPLVGVLIVIAARREAVSPRLRGVTALVASIFVLGWYGAHRESVWLSPDVFARARAVTPADAQPEFVTDVSRVAHYLSELRDKESPRCVGVSPALSLTHALSGVPGPTSLALRWNSTQQGRLADELRAADCPVFVYQMGSFDRPDQPEWFLGEDLFAISEMYEPAQQLGPATYVLRRRGAAIETERTALPVAEQQQVVPVPGEIVVPLGDALRPDDFLLLKHELRVPEWVRMLGAAPAVYYRFEADGQAAGPEVPWIDVDINVRAVASLAVQATAAEQRFILGTRPRSAAKVNALRLRFEPRGRLTPSDVAVAFSGAERWRARVPAPKDSAAACMAAEDLVKDVRDGRAMPRNVALRPKAARMSLHPNPKPEQPAEVYFPVKPCADTCLAMELGIAMAEDSGDGATVDVHVHDGAGRPEIFREDVLPGREPLQAELPLDRWANRSVMLRIGSDTRDDTAGDYLFVGSPELRRCSNRAVIAERLRRSQLTLRGNVTASGEAEVAMLAPAELSYPLFINGDTCVQLRPALEADPGTKVDFGIWVVVDGHRHRLCRATLAPEDTPHLVYSLHDWYRRKVLLTAGVTAAGGTGGGRVLLRDFTVGRCPAK
ncbi:MAG: hypothetical protein R3B13_19395 [Polyangiaceae bacterium]